MPTIVRSMAIATTDRAERCVGEIRGPVLWGETMSARSASAGDPGLFVCATTTKAYDTDENRVLKAALAVVHRAGRHAEHRHGGLHRRAGEAGPAQRPARRAAARAPDPRPGAGRPPDRPDAPPHPGRQPPPHLPTRPWRCSAGPASRCRPTHLDAFADERTRAQHDLLAATLQHLEDVTGTSPVLRSDHGGLSAGPLTLPPPGTPRRPPATSTGSPSATCCSTSPIRSTATSARRGPDSRRAPAAARAVLAPERERRRRSRGRSLASRRA